MSENKPRRGGGQPGNRNARKHGFYSSVLNREDKAKLIRASQIVGLSEEIAVVRVKLQSVMEKDPENVNLIANISSTLARLIRTQQKLGLDEGDKLQKAIRHVLTDIAAPLSYPGSSFQINKLGLSHTDNKGQ